MTGAATNNTVKTENATEVQIMPISRGYLEIKKRWCKGCNLCVGVCPKGLVSTDELGKVRVEKPENCTGCGMCEAFCPDYVITVNRYV